MKVDGQAGQDAGSFPLPSRLSVSRSMPLAEVYLGCCGMGLEFGCVSYHDQIATQAENFRELEPCTDPWRVSRDGKYGRVADGSITANHPMPDTC